MKTKPLVIIALVLLAILAGLFIFAAWSLERAVTPAY